jgi:hypothetical protein
MPLDPKRRTAFEADLAAFTAPSEFFRDMQDDLETIMAVSGARIALLSGASQKPPHALCPNAPRRPGDAEYSASPMC